MTLLLKGNYTNVSLLSGEGIRVWHVFKTIFQAISAFIFDSREKRDPVR